MIEIILTQEEIDYAISKSEECYTESRRMGLNGAPKGLGYSETLMRRIGILGEAIVAKALGLKFTARINNFKEADIGKDTQVRTADEHSKRLLLRLNDNPEHYYVLVTTEDRGCSGRIWGYVRGRDVMIDRYWNKKPTNGGDPIWLVPKTELFPFEELEMIIAADELMGITG